MTQWTVARQLCCPLDSPGKKTGVGCHFLLQGIFPTQGSNPDLPHCRQILYQLSHQGSPYIYIHTCICAHTHICVHVCAKLSLTVCNLMYWRPPGSSIHKISQATWKKPRCPSADEWIRKLWYIYTMEYYSVIKKNTFESVLMRWMKLEPIIQSEVSQKEKHQYRILKHIYGI